MTIASLIVDIGANIAGLEKTVEKVHGSLDGIGSMAKKAGAAIAAAFSVTAIAGAIKSFTDLTGELTDMSAKTGISTTALQKLKFMAEQSGGSLDQATAAITKMGVNLVKGDDSAVGAMKRLGLSIDDVRRMEPDQAFALIADKIAGIESPMERAKIATDLFGKAGADMLPMFTGHLEEAGKKAEDMGIILSEDVVAAGDDFGDALGQLMTLGMAVLGKVIGPFLPLLALLAQGLAGVATVIGNVLGPVMEGLVALGKHVIDGWILIIQKLLDFAMKIPGVSSVVGGLKAGFEALKAGAVDLHTSIVGVEKGATSAATGMGKLKYELPPTTAAVKANAAAAKELAKDYKEMAERVKKNADGHHDTEVALGKVTLSLQAYVKAHRVALELLPAFVPELESLQDRYRRVAAQVDQLIPKLGDLNEKLAEQQREGRRMIEQAEAMAEAYHRTVLGLIDTIGRFAGEVIGGSWGHAIQDMIGGWLEGTAAADAYEKATTKAGKAMAVLQGAMATWAATGAQSRLAAVGGGAASGAAAGMMFGPWGAAIGGVAGAIIGLVRSAGQGRDAVKKFAESFGGFDELHVKLLELGADGERMWVQLTQGVGKNDPKAAAAAIQMITDALEAQKNKAAEAAAVVTMKNTALIDAAVSNVNRLTSQYNALWDTIKNEAPEAVMGIVEANTRLQMEQVARQRDAEMERTKDLVAELGMNWDDVLSKLDEYIDRLGDIPAITFHTGGRLEEAPEPGFAGGTPNLDFMNFGRETRARLHGDEAVIPRGGAGQLASQIAAAMGGAMGGDLQVHVTVDVDGNVLNKRVQRVTRKAAATGRLQTLAPAGARVY